MNKQQFIERLQVWAKQALNEASTTEPNSEATWQGKYHIFTNLALYLTGNGANTEPKGLKIQIKNDRQKCIKEWQEELSPQAVAVSLGEVAAYDQTIALLKQVGDVWE